MTYHRPTVHIVGLCHSKSPRRFLGIIIFKDYFLGMSANPHQQWKAEVFTYSPVIWLGSELFSICSVLECTILFVQINLSKLAVNTGKWRNMRDLFKKKKVFQQRWNLSGLRNSKLCKSEACRWSHLRYYIQNQASVNAQFESHNDF